MTTTGDSRAPERAADDATDALLLRLITICDQTAQQAREALGMERPSCCQSAAKDALLSLGAALEAEADNPDSTLLTLRQVVDLARSRAQKKEMT